MRQPTEREIKNWLAGDESPEPPAGLAAQIKSEIPAELLANVRELTELDAPSRLSQSRFWLMAASIIFAVGGGLIVFRQMDHLPTPESSINRPVAQSMAVEQELEPTRSAEDVSVHDAESSDLLNDELSYTKPSQDPASGFNAMPIDEQEALNEAVATDETIVTDEAVVTDEAGVTDETVADDTSLLKLDLRPQPEQAAEVSSADGLAASQRPAPRASKPVASPKSASSLRLRASSRPDGLAEKSLEAPNERQAKANARKRADTTAGFEKQRAARAPQAPALESPMTVVTHSAAESAGLEEAATDQVLGRAGASPLIDATDHRSFSFSLDIGSASYKLAQGLLRESRRPPPESIRLEEFVNGFDNRSTNIVGTGLTIDIEGGPAIDSPNERHYLLRVHLAGWPVARRRTAGQPATLRRKAEPQSKPVADAMAWLELDPKLVLRLHPIGLEPQDTSETKLQSDSVEARDPVETVGHTETGNRFEAGARIDVESLAATALFELELSRVPDPGDEFGWLLVHSRSGAIERSITAADFADNWTEASPAFRLSTLVSELAKVLQQPDPAAGSHLEDLLRRARAIAAELDERSSEHPAAVELSTMIERVIELVGPNQER